MLECEHVGGGIGSERIEVAGPIENLAALEMDGDGFRIEHAGGFEAVGDPAVMITQRRRRQTTATRVRDGPRQPIDALPPKTSPP